MLFFLHCSVLHSRERKSSDIKVCTLDNNFITNQLLFFFYRFPNKTIKNLISAICKSFSLSRIISECHLLSVQLVGKPFLWLFNIINQSYPSPTLLSTPPPLYTRVIWLKFSIWIWIAIILYRFYICSLNYYISYDNSDIFFSLLKVILEKIFNFNSIFCHHEKEKHRYINVAG